MTFLDIIFERLRRDGDEPVLQEIRDGKFETVSGRELLELIQTAREYLRQAGLRKRDRCALLAPNGIRWIALDLALMAEGIVVIPLYARQAAVELAGMIRDGSPSLVCCGEEKLLAAVQSHLPAETRLAPFKTVFANLSTASRVRVVEDPSSTRSGGSNRNHLYFRNIRRAQGSGAGGSKSESHASLYERPAGSPDGAAPAT